MDPGRCRPTDDEVWTLNTPLDADHRRFGHWWAYVLVEVDPSSCRSRKCRARVGWTGQALVEVNTGRCGP